MEQLISSIQLTIPGFVYCCAILFGFLVIDGRKNFDFSGKIKIEYFSLIAIILVFASYAVGYAANIIMENCIVPICHSNNFDVPRLIIIQKDLPESVYKGLSFNYQNFIMLRHLVASTVLFTIALGIWFWRSDYKGHKFRPLIFLILLAIFFLWSYFLARHNLNELNADINKAMAAGKFIIK